MRIIGNKSEWKSIIYNTLQFYRFILLDIGEAGRHSDGGVLSHSVFGKALETNTLSIPPNLHLQVIILYYCCIENSGIFIL